MFSLTLNWILFKLTDFLKKAVLDIPFLCTFLIKFCYKFQSYYTKWTYEQSNYKFFQLDFADSLALLVAEFPQGRMSFRAVFHTGSE